ncbi:MAG: lipoprotein-releasing ABC transporter permease subunit [Desulfobacterales bacterium]|nr:MAG: lipoprotein-releasing ABC transporter permease subunit [Desulfobacterales bacterium]
MAFEYFIGRRYLRARQKQAFITLITILSIAGVTVGVMALIVVIAVMAGFEADLVSRILGGQPHVMLMRYDRAFTEYHQILKEVEKTEGVGAATPFIYTQGMLRSKSGASGAVIRGIDPETAGYVIKTLKDVYLPHTYRARNANDTRPEIPGIVLGKELARSLGVLEGDIIYLMSPRGMLSPIGHMPAMKQFKVTGFFESGMYDYDGSFAYIHLKAAQKLLRMGDSVTGIELQVKDIYKARDIAAKIKAKLGFPYWARDWMQMNRNLFRALKYERWTMFVILTLIILVAAFNIASTLIMMVMGKTRDIAILKAMGTTDGSILKIFIFNGMVIGLIGTLLGLVLGLLLCFGLENFEIYKLPGEIYYFSTTLPVKLEISNVIFIITAALGICFLATLYPAFQAVRLHPVETIRYG